MKVLIGMLALSTLAFAGPVSPMQGYQTTDHSKNDLSRFWEKVAKVEKDLKGKDCFKRANIWSYKLYKEDGVRSKKVFMHYTNKFNRELDNLGRSGLSNRLGGLFSRNIAWDFHVAPAVSIDGVDYVLDPHLRKKPLKTVEWVEFLTERGEYRLRKRHKEFLKDLKKLKKKLRRSLKSVADFPDRTANLKKKIAEIKKKMAYLGLTENPNQKVDIKCKKITHIMEFDRAQNSEWCFYQEASMYYYATRELRFLNYGNINVDLRHPVTDLSHHTEQNYDSGRRYIFERWDFDRLEQSLDEYRLNDRPDSIYEI